MLTRKHFRAIAAILADARKGENCHVNRNGLLDLLAQEFATMLAAENRAFDRTTFLGAARHGMGPDAIREARQGNGPC